MGLRGRLLGARVRMPELHQIGALVAERPVHRLRLSLGSLEFASGLQLRVWRVLPGCGFPRRKLALKRAERALTPRKPQLKRVASLTSKLLFWPSRASGNRGELV